MAAVTLDAFLVATSSADDEMNQFHAMLQTKYNIKRLWFPESYLNWTITRAEDNSINISQPAPIKALLEQTKLQDTRTKPKPLPPEPDFDDNFDTPPLDEKGIKEYQDILGSHRYLAD